MPIFALFAIARVLFDGGFSLRVSLMKFSNKVFWLFLSSAIKWYFNQNGRILYKLGRIIYDSSKSFFNLRRHFTVINCNMQSAFQSLSMSLWYNWLLHWNFQTFSLLSEYPHKINCVCNVLVLLMTKVFAIFSPFLSIIVFSIWWTQFCFVSRS